MTNANDPKPTSIPLNEFLDAVSSQAVSEGQAKFTPSEAQAKGLCWICGEPALAKCYSEAGRREYRLSSTCEKCFDEMFAELE